MGKDYIKTKSIGPEEITIRHNLKPGDTGYISYMHGWIYNKEYNFGLVFEAYVAHSFYEFLLGYNIETDRLWVAEHNGEIVGSIAIIGHGDIAQLRWFILHPDYRGIGLGRKLFNEAMDFCRSKNYKSIYLYTTYQLERAIAMYKKAGFVKVEETENNTWTEGLIELKFEVKL
ncbi:MAG: GNAT family N-acetyltransferase [Gudongella sp.]|nr:GNAT family N-acetyltransferase [Gudongella sp.]